MICNEMGHCVFSRCSSLNKLIYFVVYVDDTVITYDDQD